MNLNQKAPPNLALSPVEIILTITDQLIACNRNTRTVSCALIALARASRRLNDILQPVLVTYNVQYMGSSGLRWAVSHKNSHLVQQLLDNGGDIASEKSGYPLLVAVQRRNVDMLNLLLATANKDQVAVALKQRVNSKEDTVLHKAIQLADVPCVKALLEADANPGLLNKKYQRPVEYLYRAAKRNGQYAEIIWLLMNRNPTVMLKTLEEYNESYTKVGSTTPLILAVKRKSLDMVSFIIDSGLKHCKDELFAAFINEVDIMDRTALFYICDASNWDCDQKGCDQILAIAKLLLMHGADANKVFFEEESSPLLLCCSRPRQKIKNTRKINILRLQCDMIRLLLQSGANVNETHYYDESNYSNHAIARFLKTAQFYYTAQQVEAEDYLADSHPLSIFEEVTALGSCSLSCTSSDKKYLEKEQEDNGDQSMILELLQYTFAELLERVDHIDMRLGRYHRTLLFQTAVIPGTLGYLTTQILLEKGANPDCEDKYGKTPFELAVKKHGSLDTCSLIRRWKKTRKATIEEGFGLYSVFAL